MALANIFPSCSTMAGGLAGLVSWGLYLLLTHYGIPVTQEQLAAFVSVLIPVVVHVVPDSVKDVARNLNVSVQDVAKLMPVSEGTYPSGVNGQTQSPPQSEGNYVSGESAEPKP